MEVGSSSLAQTMNSSGQPNSVGECALPLSLAQRQLWSLLEMWPECEAFRALVVLKLEGRLDVGALDKSLNELNRRHDALRVRFGFESGKPVQLLHLVSEARINILPMWEADGRSFEERISELVRDERARKFDLRRGPLIRTTLVSSEGDLHVLMVSIHHLIMDAWSINVFLEDLAADYNRFASGSAGAQSLPIGDGFRDFVASQSEHIADNTRASAKFWTAALEGAPPLLALPTDRPRPSIRDFEGKAFQCPLGELSNELRAGARAGGVTPFIFMLSAFFILLYRYSGQASLVVGTLHANRPRGRFSRTIGYLAGTLLLRADLDGAQTVQDVLQATKRRVLDSYEHPNIPIQEVLSALRVDTSLHSQPFFQTMFVFQPTERTLPKLQGIDVAALDRAADKSKYDLSFSVNHVAGRFELNVEYSTALFDERTVRRMVEHYLGILRQMSRAPKQSVGHLSVLTGADVARLRNWSDGPSSCVDARASLRVEIEAAIARFGARIAVADATQRLTYAELSDRADTLARKLRIRLRYAGSAERLVGICLTPSTGFVVAMLAAMKAGAVYVPLDPKDTTGKQRFVVNDSGLRIVITDAESARMVEEMDVESLRIDSNGSLPSDLDPSEELPFESQFTYLIYTSGSTGKPKGSAISSRAFLNLVRWYTAEFELRCDDAVAVISPMMFDLTQKNIFGALAVGAKIVFPAMELFDPRTILGWIADEHVTWINSAPSAFYTLVAASSPGCSEMDRLRWVILGGEKIDVKRIAPVLGNEGRAAIVNTYGPTECTDVVTFHVLDGDESSRAPVSIGRPIPGTKILILDKANQVVPVGIFGEIHVAGLCVSEGYVNRPQLTAEKFIDIGFDQETMHTCPLAEAARQPSMQIVKVYRTGDIGRWRDNGTIEFAGRADSQVKVNGCRVELGEVEEALKSIDGVADAVVVCCERGSASSHLAGFLLPCQKDLIDVNVVWNSIRTMLPPYMIPSTLAVIDTFPLNANGKIDRPQLLLQAEQPVLEANASEPVGLYECTLCRIWSDVLGIERTANVDADFFHLGGTSLSAFTLLAQIKNAFDVEFSMRELYETRSISSMARAVERALARQARLPAR